MAALSDERPIKYRATKAPTTVVMGTGIIYAGGMVMINGAGEAVAAADTAGAVGVVGIAQETVDNSAGASDVHVEICEGEFLMDASSVAQTNVGEQMYVVDDQTVDETSPANNIKAGIMTELVSATSCWVRIGLDVLF